MSRSLGSALPPHLYTLLGRERTAWHEGKAIPIVTTDPQGRPHPALLSYDEVAATDPQTIRLAIGSQSQTAKNLGQRQAVTVLVLDSGLAYYLKGSARELKPGLAHSPGSALFAVRLEEVLEDQAREDTEAGIRLTGGVTFQGPEGMDPEKRRQAFLELLGE